MKVKLPGVAAMTTERVAGVSRIDDQPGAPYDFGGSLDQPRLRMRGMDDEILCHSGAIKPSALCIRVAPENVVVDGLCWAAPVSPAKGRIVTKCRRRMADINLGNKHDDGFGALCAQG